MQVYGNHLYFPPGLLRTKCHHELHAGLACSTPRGGGFLFFTFLLDETIGWMQELLRNPERLQRLLEQNPALMSVLQAKMQS